MPSVLQKMTAEVFSTYLEKAIIDYAQDNVASGRWPQAGALERSRKEHDQLLPQGLDTADNHLFEIISTENGSRAGYLWLAIENKFGAHTAFIFDIEVHAQYRRQGHARRALLALEEWAKECGASSIGLHVFKQNAAAQALYASLGYEVVSSNMVKPLGGQVSGRPRN